MMRAEVVICIIISPGCYSRSWCNDNAIWHIGLRCNYYDQSCTLYDSCALVLLTLRNFSGNFQEEKYNLHAIAYSR